MQLIQLTELLDLPRHDGAVRFLKLWDLWTRLLALVMLWVVSVLVVALALGGLLDVKLDVYLGWIMLACLAYAGAVTFMPQRFGLAWGPLATIGLVAGIGYGLLDKTGDAGTVIMAAIAGLGLGLATSASIGFLSLAVLLVDAVLKCLNWLPALVARAIFHGAFPAWKGVAEIGPRGYQRLVAGRLKDPRAFVAHKKLRRNGAAGQVAGAPLFTWHEIHDQNHVRQTMQRWSEGTPASSAGGQAGPAALGGAALAGFSMDDLAFPAHDVNPATGLPMMAGMGSLDVAGNSYGLDNVSAAGDDIR